MKEANLYHYTESGLDTIWLESGFEIVELPSGPHVRIQDIEGLHQAIGMALVDQKTDLTSKEFRYLRKEMLLSQSALARLLQVSEPTIQRWETGKADISKPAITLMKLMYRDMVHDISKKNFRAQLDELANLEDKIDGHKMTIKKNGDKPWKLAKAA